MDISIKLGIIGIVIPILISASISFAVLKSDDTGLKKDVVYISKTVDRHESRIMSNQIGVEKVGDRVNVINSKVNALEALHKQILTGIIEIKTSMCEVKADVASTQVIVGILRDRQERGIEDGIK